MRTGPFLLSSLLVLGTVAARVANGDVAGNPYRQAIVDRNVFGLKTPPPPPDPTPPKPPTPKITLVGIVTVFGTKKAVLRSAEAPKPAAPGQPPAANDSYVLTEGQSQQGISVLAIDEKAGSVKVDNNGDQETLTFEKNGDKLVPGPAVPAPGAAPAGLPAGIPRPGMPGGLPMRPGMPGVPGVPSVSAGSLGAGGGSLAGTTGTDGGIPARNVRLPTEQAPLSRDEQIVMFEVMREKYKNSATPLPIPPTPLTPYTDQGAPSPFAR